MDEKQGDEWIAPSEAARRLAVSPGRITQLRQRGVLDAYLTPLGNLISAASVERYGARRKTGHGARSRDRAVG